jgi:hypothetical protein
VESELSDDEAASGESENAEKIRKKASGFGKRQS